MWSTTFPKIAYLQFSNSLKHLSLESNISKISQTCIHRLKATVNTAPNSLFTWRLKSSTRKINRFPGSALQREKPLDSINLHIWQHKNNILKFFKKGVKIGIYLPFLKDVNWIVSLLNEYLWKRFHFSPFLLEEFLFHTVLKNKIKGQREQKETY